MKPVMTFNSGQARRRFVRKKKKWFARPCSAVFQTDWCYKLSVVIDLSARGTEIYPTRPEYLQEIVRDWVIASMLLLLYPAPCLQFARCYRIVHFTLCVVFARERVRKIRSVFPSFFILSSPLHTPSGITSVQ
jgi:hypothetical protein